MKPFDLSAALAGAPVCTRDGREVTQLVKFDCEYEYCVFGIVEGGPISWLESGRHLESMESDDDLFMAPTKKTGWVVRCRSKNGEYINGSIYANEEKARNRNINSPHALSYHQIEWEE